MLRYQTRPKSQPPLKFKPQVSSRQDQQPDSSKSKQQDNWNKYTQEHIENNNSKTDDQLNLIKRSNSNNINQLSSSESSSSGPSSASSSSSLNSSSLSIESSSSTSTVLAAAFDKSIKQKSTIQSLRSKSIISRYSGSSLPGEPQEHQSTSEDDDQEANHSSSSSTSSSSGLSSMNSSSNATQHSSLQADTCAALEIDECISELIDSVVNGPSVSRQVNDSYFNSFQVHQVLLAKTRSQTTTSGSSDDDNSNEPSARNKSPKVQRPPSSLSSGSSVSHHHFKLLRRDKQSIGSRHEELISEIRLIKPQMIGLNSISSFKTQASLVVGAPNGEEILFGLARDCLGENPSEAHNFLACVNGENLTIESLNVNEFYSQLNNSAKFMENFVVKVNFTQIVNSYVRGNLLVWLVDRHQGNQSQLRAEGSNLRVIDSPQVDENNNPTSASEELKTTLDDIALALDEPIETQAEVNREDSRQIEAIVWLCSCKEQANAFCDLYKSLRFNVLVAEVLSTEESCPSDELASECLAQTPDAGDLRESKKGESLFSVDLISMADVGHVTDGNKRLSSERNSPTVNHQAGEAKLTDQLVSKSKAQVLADSGLSSSGDRVAPVSVNEKNNELSRAEQMDRDKHEHQPVVKSSLSRAKQQLRLSIESDKILQTQVLARNQEDRFKGKASIEWSSPSNGLDVKPQKRNELAPVEVSGTESDLGVSGSSPQQSNANLSGSSTLASYYKSVASRVLSNGQSRIKSFKEEMIRLNNRASILSSSSGSNLSSPSSKSHSSDGSMRKSCQLLGGSACNLSSSTSKANQEPDSRSIKVKKPDERKPIDHQRRGLILKSSGSQQKLDTLMVSSQVQAPTVKPRTSILKNKQPQVSTTSDTSTSTQSNSRQPEYRCPSTSQRQTQCNIRRPHPTTGDSESSKPKSILKNSKSMSNISNLEGATNGSSMKGQSSKSIRLAANEQQQVHLKHQSVAHLNPVQRTELLLGQQHHTSHHKATAGQSIRISAKSSSHSLNRRSTCSMVLAADKTRSRKDVDQSSVDHQQHPEQQQEASDTTDDRELAFERLRQRASCYDITRLMSKNRLHSQLSKLRVNSSNSLAAKTRQRRPALIVMEDERKNHDDNIDTHNKITHDHQDQLDAADATRCDLNNNEPDNYNNYDKTQANGNSSYSEPDGTVRARVSQSHTKSNIVQMNWNKPEETKLTLQVNEPNKRSEFDPRSLRRGNIDTSSSLVISNESTDSSLSNRRKSITNVALHSLAVADEQQVNNTKESESKKKSHSNLSVVRVARDVSASDDSASGSQAEDDGENPTTEEDEPSDTSTINESSLKTAKSSPALSKSGPFSLLRQSFSQKSLSSMLKFSGRASLRVKTSPNQKPAVQDQDSPSPADLAAEKAKAIAIAEANLLAAKQLKHQAQRLKEQQKRELQQQQQQGPIDAATMMLAAAQYNQQIMNQRQQQQQQQQQLLYAQQYAVATRGHLFDQATSVHLQHQMLFQRHQQHQQMAYMSNLTNSAHYMSQQMAVMSPAAQMMPMGALHASAPPTHQMIYIPQAAQAMPSAIQPAQGQSSSGSSLFRRSILRKSTSAPKQQQMMYQAAQATPANQFIPMSVNHHSSFNIVYAGSNGGQEQAIYEKPSATVNNQQPPVAPAKTSLGASMRKTVKSILVNRSPFHSNSSNNPGETSKGQVVVQQEVKLKSALKSSASRELVLNSEGSDGDGSSSDSTANWSGDSPSAKVTLSVKHSPKSVLKKKSSNDELATGNSSPDSSSMRHDEHNFNQRPMSTCFAEHKSNISATKGSTLGRNMAYRQSVRGDHPDLKLKAERKNSISSSGRKNVTFSTKLTSIQ